MHESRPAGKPRPAKKTKSDATTSTGGSSASTQFGELMEQELRKDDIHSNQSTMGLAETLTSDQLYFFNSRGYLLIESFSSNEEVDALRKRMNELLHGFDPSSSDP
ncbi:hypothetical protein Tco_0522079, partial [Tanacetum coccineum]